MGQVVLVTGQAGTGKTTWLMREAKDRWQRLGKLEQQRMLVVTRMHGARRRLDTKLNELCPDIPRSVTTIDSFALSILNRWRTCFGYLKPVIPTSDNADFVDTSFGIQAEFGKIRTKASYLLKSRTVGRVIGMSYPLILIDEFQDCHGSMLDFVKSLAMHSELVMAGDDFQLLDPDALGCEAIEWVRNLESSNRAVVEELDVCHRTSSQALLQAARCLRDNVPSPSPTIPVMCCPGHGLAALQIIRKLIFNKRGDRWTGTCALISPTKVPFLNQVIQSCSNQLAKKGLTPLHWYEELRSDEELGQILQCLGLAECSMESDEVWCGPSGDLDSFGKCVCERITRFSKLKGLGSIPKQVAVMHVEKVTHERRSYSPHSSKRIVTTVHGAKNREFDNVFVLWPYQVRSDLNAQRRLLYNAITRSKSNCVVLVQGDAGRAANDPVLSLLGPAQSAIPKNRTPKPRAAKKAKAR